jgi:uncharacterized protein
MLLPPHKVTDVAREMLQLLQREGNIETNMPREVQLDLEAVLNQYIRTEQELSTRARQTLDSRGLNNRDFARVLRSLAEQKGVKVGEEGMDYVLDQLLEMLLNSSNVEEIYAEDHELRRQLRIPLRKLEDTAQKAAVKSTKSKVKAVPEITLVWELEYQRMMEDIRRRRGI